MQRSPDALVDMNSSYSSPRPRRLRDKDEAALLKIGRSIFVYSEHKLFSNVDPENLDLTPWINPGLGILLEISSFNSEYISVFDYYYF